MAPKTLKDEINRIAEILSYHGYCICGGPYSTFKGTPDEFVQLLELALWQVKLRRDEPNDSGHYTIYLVERGE